MQEELTFVTDTFVVQATGAMLGAVVWTDCSSNSQEGKQESTEELHLNARGEGGLWKSEK